MHARGLLPLLLVCLCCASARADWQTRSWSRWQIGPQGAEAVVGIERAELARLGLPADAAWLQQAVAASVTFGNDGQDCPLRASTPASGGSQVLAVRLRFDCEQPPGTASVRVRFLLDGPGEPLHYATLRGGGRERDALLTRAADSVELPPAAAPPRGTAAVLGDYVALGFHHILAGLDHVAFLLCMLLVSPRLGHRIWMVTGFTLGHSLTLSLSSLGLVRVQGAAVEALIGFTVALLAAEAWQRARGTGTAGWLLGAVPALLLAASLQRGGIALPPGSLVALLVLAPAYLALARRQRDPVRLHLGMTAVFGLVHGLGFAAVLRAIGLPTGQQGWALAGFNVGVELGQLALLGVFAGTMALLARLAGAWRERLAEQAAAALLCALGVWWLVQRSL